MKTGFWSIAWIFLLVFVVSCTQKEVKEPIFNVRIENLDRHLLTASVNSLDDGMVESAEIKLFNADGVQVGQFHLERYSQAGRMYPEPQLKIDGYDAEMEEGVDDVGYPAVDPVAFSLESQDRRFIFNLYINRQYKDWLVANFKID